MDNRKNSGRKTGDKSELLSKDEMNRLLDSVKNDLYFYTLYSLLRYSGRRIGEIYGTYVENYVDGKINKSQIMGGLQLKDINFSEKTIRTKILKNTKVKTKRICNKCNAETKRSSEEFCSNCGEKLETINIQKLLEEKRKNISTIYMPMTENIYEILQKYIAQNPQFVDDDYIFRTISLKLIQKKIKKHLLFAKIDKKFSIHGFRTYFISQLIKNGMTENQIIKWTGHRSTASLTSYNQLIPDDIKDRVNNIEF